jgi:hypothetical protein
VKKVLSCKCPKKGKMSMEEFLPKLQGLMGSPSNSDSEKTVTSLEDCEME